MFETLFGADVPPALKFFLAFVIVLALIGVTAWLVRRFGADRFGGSAARGRQPRLALVDAAAVDNRRRLIIIRRDNVEHLLMIGGPNDVLVEQNIVRAMGAPRDKTEPSIGRGLAASDTLTRPVPLGEGTMWPLQPQPETNGRPPRTIPDEPVQWTWPAHSEPQRPPRPEPRLEKPDTLTNIADELSTRPAPPREPAFARPATPPASRTAPTPPAPAPTPVAAPAPVVQPPVAPAAAPFVKVDIDEKIIAQSDSDQNLADMANKLEASLRRPNEPRFTESPVPARAEPMTPPPRATPPEPKPARAETKAPPPEAKPKALYDSLEEEMASLLGRPPGKT